jgi:DNA-binding FadR family transcriptional regulator
MTLRPIRPGPSTAELCASRLREAILSEGWTPGSRLPPERALAETLGVNRTTLRTALASLVQNGLVQVRQGSGYQVCDYRTTGGPRLLNPLLKHTNDPALRRVMLDDLLTVRRALAQVVVTRLANDNAGPTKDLIAARDQFRELSEAGAPTEDLANADAAFVRAVVAQAGSAVFSLCLNPIEMTVRAMPALRAVVYADPIEVARGHDAFLAWLHTHPRDANPILVEMEHRDRQNVEAFLASSGGLS